MSKRKNDGEINGETKQPRRNNVDSKEIAVSVNVLQNQKRLPPILKLNAICCDDLFDWLSLEDLHSLGQTCKRMQRLTAIHFKRNFKDLFPYCIEQNLSYAGIRLDGFMQFIQNIKFYTDYSTEKDFQYIGLNCDSLRHVSFISLELTKSKIDCIKVRLDKIETIHMIGVEIPSSVNLYEDFLKCSPNLKTLFIYDLKRDDNCYEWLCHKYSKLEHLKFYYNRSRSLSRILEIFFQKNPQLKKFETRPCFLLDNSETFINTKTKLDVLTIRYDDSNKMNNLKDVEILLNKLYDNGEKLKLGVLGDCNKAISQAQMNQIGKLRGLERLNGYFAKNLVFSTILSLREIYISNSRLENIYLETMTVSFPNLHQVRLFNVSENQMLPFIRRLPRLKVLKILYFTEDLKKIPTDGFNLSTLNEERKKLSGACKFTLYVCERLYLKTKLAPKNLYNNHDLIEIKSNGDCEVL